MVSNVPTVVFQQDCQDPQLLNNLGLTARWFRQIWDHSLHRLRPIVNNDRCSFHRCPTQVVCRAAVTVLQDFVMVARALAQPLVDARAARAAEDTSRENVTSDAIRLTRK